MKQIVIHQENSHPLYIVDEDETQIDEYSKRLSVILEASNVTILETSSGCVILRPHRINSIEVKIQDIKINIEPNTTQDNQEEKTKNIKETLTNEDLITDGD